MLAKEFRLPYRQRLSHPLTLRHSLFIIKFAHSENPAPRLGVIISKKVDNRATVRNRMRRLLHDYFMNHLTEFSVKRDYLFIVTKPFTDLDIGSIHELRQLMSKAR